MEISSKITTKIFVGCHITSELRMHLSKSKEWKQLSVVPIEARESKIQEIHFKDKDYFGYYLIQDAIQISELQKIKTSIQLILKKYCPGYEISSLKVYALPQLFVA